MCVLRAETDDVEQICVDGPVDYDTTVPCDSTAYDDTNYGRIEMANSIEAPYSIASEVNTPKPLNQSVSAGSSGYNRITMEQLVAGLYFLFFLPIHSELLLSNHFHRSKCTR